MPAPTLLGIRIPRREKTYAFGIKDMRRAYALRISFIRVLQYSHLPPSPGIRKMKTLSTSTNLV
jgi:hypothetical protein